MATSAIHGIFDLQVFNTVSHDEVGIEMLETWYRVPEAKVRRPFFFVAHGHFSNFKLGVMIELKGADIEVVELIVAIWLTQQVYVNGKPATLQFLFDVVEKHARRPIPNFHGKIQDLKKRKKDPAAKLNAMLRALLAYLDRS